MDTIAEIAALLRRDGYNILNQSEVLIGLEEDLHYSHSDAIAIAPQVVAFAHRANR